MWSGDRAPCIKASGIAGLLRRGAELRAGTLPIRDGSHRYGTPHAPRSRPPARSAPAPVEGAIIDLRSVTKRYSKTAIGVEDVSFAVQPGEFVFVVSASGSGKSTPMRLLIKESEPTFGSITVAGHDLGRSAQGSRTTAATSAWSSRTSSCCRTGRSTTTSPTRSRSRGGTRARSARRCRTSCASPASRPRSTTSPTSSPAASSSACRCARVRQPPAAAAGRRADRQPRPRDLDRDHAAAVPDQPHRHDGDRRHPRQVDGRPHAAGA